VVEARRRVGNAAPLLTSAQERLRVRARLRSVFFSLFGLSHNFDLHLGQIVITVPRGIQSCPHRRHLSVGTLIRTAAPEQILPIGKFRIKPQAGVTPPSSGDLTVGECTKAPARCMVTQVLARRHRAEHEHRMRDVAPLLRDESRGPMALRLFPPARR